MKGSEIATKGDLQQLRQEFKQDKQDLIRAIEQIGKPERMTLQEVADEWGVQKPTASKRLKRMYQAGKVEKADFDSQPITVNRKEFFEGINQ